MMFYEVAPTKIARAGHDVFTYASEHTLQYGTIVLVELGKKTIPAVVLDEIGKPSYATKTITSLIEPTPLPKWLVATALWMKDYYRTPLATVWQTILPRGITKTRRVRAETPRDSTRDRTHFLLNKAQQSAVDKINSMTPGTAILHGITGSGKTRIYIELVQQVLESGKSAVVLVPEIALTSQLVDDFSHHFKDIIVAHSRQTEAERHTAWRKALTSEAPLVVIGPRSALFLPIHAPGLIVVDEAHEPSFKQEQAPRYSTLRVASFVAQYTHTKAIFGSATPPISDYYIAEKLGRPIITLTEKAVENAAQPEVILLDATKRDTFHKHRFLSDILLKTLEDTFADNKQALIFHNRRGSSATTLCEQCGWTAMCPRCFVPLTLHADAHTLRCHICNHHERVPTSCPQCHFASIIHKGIGTKLLESELVKLFPKQKIARFDADTATEETVEKRYPELYDGSIDLIIGTQVIAKGLDLPHLRTVGIVQADAGLSLPDYSASERAFQLIAQAVGRVGRSTHATKVIVQSYQPTHPAVVYGISQNYAQFYIEALGLRHQGGWPPFRFLLKLTCTYKTEQAAVRNARQLLATLKQHAAADVTFLGPAPAFYEKQRDTYRWQITVKSPKREHLAALLAHVPSAYWQAELDPSSLLS